jgi:hypothetical protein
LGNAGTENTLREIAAGQTVDIGLWCLFELWLWACNRARLPQGHGSAAGVNPADL